MHKFAIIGCGEIAQQHAAQINKIGKLQAVCDIIPEKADRLASLYNANAYQHIDELLAKETDVDIVCVCTPNGSHAEHCIKSLQHNKHVLCEAPLCLTSAAAWQMVETEKFCRRKLTVVNPVFFDKKAQAFKKKLTTQDVQLPVFYVNARAIITEEQYKDWKGKAFPGGGALYTAFNQLMAALAWLLGPIEEAKGITGTLAHINSIELEDTGIVSLKMKSGALGNLQWSLRTDGHTENSITLFDGNEPVSISILTESGESDKGAIYEEIYDHFLKSLDRSEPSDIYESMKTVEAIEKIYKATSPNPTAAH